MQNKSSVRQSTLSVTFVWLAVAFCVCLITSNLFVPRVWKVWGLNLQLTGGVLIFPISYIINDCLTEVYGYRKARLVIWMGFALSAFVAIMSQIATMLPDPLVESSQPTADSFNALFSMVPRTTIASLIAFIIGSTTNAWIMSKMKLLSKGKGFGNRAILSSVAGELIDSLIFFPVVFIGIMDFKTIIGMMLTQIVVKVGYEIVILPITARVAKALKKKEGIDTFDNDISYNPFKISDI